MNSGSKRFAQKALAVVLVVALLDFVGVPVSVLFFVTVVALALWLMSRRYQNRELQAIFQFYVAADAILRDEDRRWFAFEVADIIDQGESALDAMPDPPPLQLFAIGALYHKIGNYEATVEYLSRIEEKEFAEEYRVVPSPQLRRYVSMLRDLEQDPSVAPLALGAIRNLERGRSRNAARLLSESRSMLEPGPVDRTVNERHDMPLMNGNSAPPSISEVLQDIYPEDGGSGIN